MNCPECGAEIQADRDLLVVHWYQPKQWWVTSHFKAGLRPNSIHPELVWQNEPYQLWCGRADINTVIQK